MTSRLQKSGVHMGMNRSDGWRVLFKMIIVKDLTIHLWRVGHPSLSILHLSLSLNIPTTVFHLRFLPSNLSLLAPDFLILPLILPGSLPVPMSFVNLHYLPPSIPLPPSRATLGLLDSHSPMLSCSRARPEQRAH